MIEGSGFGSGSIPVPRTNGSGSRRPKKMWIRIRNTNRYRYRSILIHDLTFRNQTIFSPVFQNQKNCTESCLFNVKRSLFLRKLASHFWFFDFFIRLNVGSGSESGSIKTKVYGSCGPGSGSTIHCLGVYLRKWLFMLSLISRRRWVSSLFSTISSSSITRLLKGKQREMHQLYMCITVRQIVPKLD